MVAVAGAVAAGVGLGVVEPAAVGLRIRRVHNLCIHLKFSGS